jgi:hypothetical protein
LREGCEVVWKVFGKLVLQHVPAEIGLIVDVSLILDVILDFGEQPKEDEIVPTLEPIQNNSLLPLHCMHKERDYQEY